MVVNVFFENYQGLKTFNLQSKLEGSLRTISFIAPKFYDEWKTSVKEVDLITGTNNKKGRKYFVTNQKQ